MLTSRTVNFQADQVISSFINKINNDRFLRFEEAILEVEKELEFKLIEQDVRMLESISYIEKVRNFVGNPDGILGNLNTKHGEIAEQVEVGIRNARDALRGEDISASFELLGRTAPEDYRIGDLLYQSKFVNSSTNTLDHILEHMGKYENFKLRDDTKYHIPRDQYKLIKNIINDKDVEGIHSRTILSLKSKVAEIEEITGRNFFDKIESGDSAYAEVQIKKVSETLNNHETVLEFENQKIKQSYEKEAREKGKAFEYIREPNFGEFLKAGIIGAGVSATMKFTFIVYKKLKNENKHIYEYEKEDWKEIGIDVGKYGFKGGISGISIYTLTNFAFMPAPIAGGYVTATFSIVNLVKKYKKGIIEFEDFLVESEAICVEAGLTMTCALIGQAFIPIPVFGAIVGSVVGSMVSGPIMDKIKEELSKQEIKLIEKYNTRYQRFISNLEAEEQKYYKDILECFNKIESLEDLIFNPDINSSLRLEKSVRLSEKYGVEDNKIVKNIDEIDALFM